MGMTGMASGGWTMASGGWTDDHLVPAVPALPAPGTGLLLNGEDYALGTPVTDAIKDLNARLRLLNDRYKNLELTLKEEQDRGWVLENLAKLGK